MVLNNNLNTNSIINNILKYDTLIIFIGFGIVICASIIITVMYENTLNMRNNVLFTNMLAIVMGILFIYLIFSFMGQTIKILQFNIDFGLILFITLGLLIIFVLGD